MLTVKDYVSTSRADRARVLSELQVIRKQVGDLAAHMGDLRGATAVVVQPLDQSIGTAASDSLLNSAVARVNQLMSEVDGIIARYPPIIEAPDGA